MGQHSNVQGQTAGPKIMAQVQGDGAQDFVATHMNYHRDPGLKESKFFHGHMQENRRPALENTFSLHPKNSGGGCLEMEVFEDANDNGDSSAEEGDIDIAGEGANQTRVERKGAASPAFFRNCKQYVDKHKPILIVIMETRTSPLNLKRSFQLLGYDGFQYAENNGFSGGIIVSWKEQLLDVEVLVNHFQFLHLKVTLQCRRIFFFSSVYASPREEGRHELWRELKNISRGMVGEWLLAGDFNDISHPSEKKGGIPAQQRRCNTFVDRINDCKLMDCGATGPKFTWRGPVFQNDDRIFERLDRALSNDEWRLGFPNAVV
ncbi:endonuclease/exonuclease/phosphatase family protein [Trifolium medium]|uniref:Endonuclease/exonuclease/phosphatase family protein n=1 Tax=Trifolium medium TaxID=97028 RepID=A0A392LWC4_9FABA|nr:endonuclease/exonuclease/phosphatase family protein [Trifolium medium]